MEFEEITEQLPSALADHHAVWLGDRLQARGEVWRLADDAALLCFAGSDQIADANPRPSSSAAPCHRSRSR
jgi:hypothetical protein